MPASTIDPPVGAWVYTSGIHVWNGTSGILTAKATPKAHKSSSWSAMGRCTVARAREMMSKEALVPEGSWAEAST